MYKYTQFLKLHCVILPGIEKKAWKAGRLTWNQCFQKQKKCTCCASSLLIKKDKSPVLFTYMGLAFLGKRQAGFAEDQKNICQNSTSVGAIMAFNI